MIETGARQFSGRHIQGGTPVLPQLRAWLRHRWVTYAEARLHRRMIRDLEALPDHMRRDIGLPPRRAGRTDLPMVW